MANETLKAFYYGNLCPSARRMVHGSEVARIAKELSDTEAELSRSLLPELQPVLERFTKAQNDLDSIMAEANYIDGFKIGARFMMEILDDARENLKPVTEEVAPWVQPHDLSRTPAITRSATTATAPTRSGT